jgi:methylated-DNA-[protein]-cysteine S-methyltransferase
MNDSFPHYLFIETPIGVMTLSYADRPFRLIEVCFPSGKMKTQMDTHLVKNPGSRHPIRQTVKLLNVYFKGRPIDPPWNAMSLEAFTPLQQAVLHETAAIPFGSVRTYGGMAAAIGRPNAYRFVGTTLAKNPYPILIPCHRVIRTDKGMGGFGGGIGLKQRLIDFEAHHR